MATLPLPTDDEVLLTRPDAAEVEATARGIATAVAPAGGLTSVQQLLLEALFPAMTGHPVDLSDVDPMSSDELAEVLRRRNLAFRTRVVQIMLLAALVLRPLPADVVARVRAAAAALGVDDALIDVAQEFAEGSLELAAIDFERNGYTASWSTEDAVALHTTGPLQEAWQAVGHDVELAARWEALADLPDGTLGRGVWDLYQARGFAVPGTPGSAPPLLAQHDWVHVLADYGTTVEAELEVFALIARADDAMRAFSLLAMVVSLFETGYLRTGAGLFEASPGHLSTGRQVAIRVADAMRRGALCHDTVTGSDSIDFLRIDWFDVAGMTIDAARSRFCLPPKAPEAIAAGSVGPWERGGISEFQQAAGRRLAAGEGRQYDGRGATPG